MLTPPAGQPRGVLRHQRPEPTGAALAPAQAAAAVRDQRLQTQLPGSDGRLGLLGLQRARAGRRADAHARRAARDRCRRLAQLHAVEAAGRGRD